MTTYKIYKMTPNIFLIILLIVGIWIIRPFIEISDRDVFLYKKNSEWIKIENI
ncbi:hypothetical protein BSF42_10250 [Flavobacterium sp. ACN6]|nr:hypothetical protein BSF42_10250 [Flavobacterium sp. ACN6]